MATKSSMVSRSAPSHSLSVAIPCPSQSPEQEDETSDASSHQSTEKESDLSEDDQKSDYAATLDLEDVIKAKSEGRLIEMIWFGGINAILCDAVYHVTLKLDFLAPEKQQDKEESVRVNGGKLTIRKLYNKKGDLVNLKHPDRFFYNQEFYLQQPTAKMVEQGLGYQGNKYTMKWFDKNRFIGAIGRMAFHIFDLEAMDFVYADLDRGYSVNLDELKE
eukprot:CAMPEP_0170457592 /NCGR_PEP_ID=MMETSP0123-20130129/4839_1 /TAXON_ID=182087 /ORGANISM="Favella ehrenbergii, Strain Fehren 1" /LENGTH=217 /DNA_ID=CAMNT_0010721449 /DNA_START=869 /DNA_END=1521 /DNA_ORIENTATION=+